MLMDDSLATAVYGYLTTVGRLTGNPHTIEIWFAVDGETIYLLSGSGGRSDWSKNLRQQPSVTFRIRTEELPGSAREVTDPAEDARARDLVVAKYQPSYGGDLTGWRERAAVFAVDLD